MDVRAGRPWGLVAVAVLLVAGCTGTAPSPSTDDHPRASGSVTPTGPATVRIQPARGAADVAPADPVVVAAAGGTLRDVRVTAGSGSVRGAFDAGRTAWRSSGPLGFGARYTVQVTAADAAGRTVAATSAFTTATPRTTVFPAVSPLRGSTVGVGMPIRVYFDAPVPDRRAAVDRMEVTTSVPTEGGWRWFSDREVHWRPRTYWEPRTRVTLATSLHGVQLGPGAYGRETADRHIDFTVGRSHVSVADARTHRMKVYVDGKLVRTLPVSMGKAVPGQHTKSGAHVVTDKNRVKVMDSTTYGLALDAGGYRTKVDHAVRISNSGEFVHSAPWSVAQQGRENVSHGCINLSPANAAWFFGLAQVGDVVEVRGTPVKLSAKDTDVPDWTIPWDRWGE